jgi:hypothetical protein
MLRAKFVAVQNSNNTWTTDSRTSSNLSYYYYVCCGLQDSNFVLFLRRWYTTPTVCCVPTSCCQGLQTHILDCTSRRNILIRTSFTVQMSRCHCIFLSTFTVKETYVNCSLFVYSFVINRGPKTCTVISAVRNWTQQYSRPHQETLYMICSVLCVGRQ